MTPELRKQIYALMILLSAGLMFGRIIAVDNEFDKAASRLKYQQVESRVKEREAEERKKGVTGKRLEEILNATRQKLQKEALQLQRPSLSANDRSRLCTVRALVEPDMRVKDENGNIVWFAIDKVQNLPGWDTIDMVKHPLPPSDPEAPAYLFSSKPPLLPILMAAPYYVIYIASGGKISFASDPYLVVRTLLVIINLIPVMFCWFLMSRLIDRFATTDWSRLFLMAFVCFGTFVSTFVVTLNNHLPGICCVIISMYAAIQILFEEKRSLVYFLTAGFFAALLPACELPGLAYTAFLMGALALVSWRRTLLGYVPAMVLVLAAFLQTNYIGHQTYSLAYGNPDWYIYKYERGGRERVSHWTYRTGMDKGEKSKMTYAFHTSVGHHGIFSLTPLWVLSFFGLAAWMFQRGDKRLFYAAIFILSLSLIVYVFYMHRPQGDRNYGGMTSGLRWMFWFIPMWIMAMTPTVNRLSRSRLGRGLCLVLLFCSALSVAYPLWNPWDHPWLYHFLRYCGWKVIGAG